MKSSPDKFNILYLDDEQSNLEIFRISFKREYNVFTAIDHEQAFEILRNHPIHLILTDQQMPGMKGTEFLEKTLKDYPDIIRMILTGYADISVVMDAVNKCGIYRYITKPWERDDMKMTLETALESYKLKEENKNLVAELREINANLEKKIEEKIKEIKSYNEGLRHKNEEILAINRKMNHSIRYASKIQQALLPKDSDILRFFSDFFVVDAPLDVISGDFYWFTQISEKEAYLAVVDCTGHGVPGALMSIIGHNLFSKAVKEHLIKAPKDILQDIHEEMASKIFKANAVTSDGMDAALCRFEKAEDNQVKVTFAGARRPIYVLQEGFLLEIAGSRKSIGGLQIYSEGKYEEHTLMLSKGDQIYMFSDGWADIANEHRKKYGLKRLKEMIIQSSNMSAEEQKIMMMQDLAEYKQDTPQRDDILMLSVRL
jgi:serine phosphatase RsbU (regulator of sigma subunit)